MRLDLEIRCQDGGHQIRDYISTNWSTSLTRPVLTTETGNPITGLWEHHILQNTPLRTGQGTVLLFARVDQRSIVRGKSETFLLRLISLSTSVCRLNRLGPCRGRK
jgi:hypothetical protein